MKKLIILFFLLFIFSLNLFSQNKNTIAEPTQNPLATYRLFRTENFLTFIKLNTVTGQMWQVQFSVGDKYDSFSYVLNLENLAKNKTLVKGRFTLYQTSNIYTFILLDQIDGEMWQVQWSIDQKYRFIMPIE